MQALQLTHPQHFEAVQVPDPTLQDTEMNHILVQLKYGMICGSDIPIFLGTQKALDYPLLAGMHLHECIGQVVESLSPLVSVGEWVVAIPERNQGLAEFFIASENKCASLPTGLPITPVCPLIQPISTVIHAVDKLGDIRGSQVAIVGLGPIGQLVCWLLHQRGAEVVGIDPRAGRCKTAQIMGASKTIAMRSSDLVQSIQRNQIDWDSPDICIEAVGHQTYTINDCISLVRPRGIVLGMGVPDEAIYPLAYELLFRRNLHLITSDGSNGRPHLTQAGFLLQQHYDELKVLVTDILPIKETQQAFELYKNQSDIALKVVLDASQW